jgi:hypothetical protein
VLRRERLARVRVDESGTTSIETYHDRVRAAATAAMTEAERRAVHRALAAAYESATSAGDLDAAVGHWMAAGDTARAAARAESAAAIAEAGLAFHRAAELYALALAHGAATGDERRDLLRKRAEALTSAGRLDEAAAAFADAADGAPPDAALALDIRRLEQILRRGRFVDGRALAEAMLARIGIALPRTRAGTLRALAVQLIRLRLRGTGFTERAEADVAPDRLRAIDLLFSVATAMGMINPAHGMLVQCHHLRAALDAGEPRRACSALAIELGYLGQRGAPAERRALALSGRVEALADRIGDPYVRGRATTMRGFLCFLLGRWRDAALLTAAGLTRMTEDGVGVRWDFDVIEMVHLAALTYLGEARELARLVPLRLREAESRGDVYAPGDLRGGRGNIAWLVVGRPEQARAHLEAVALPAPTAADHQVRHLDQLISAAHIDLYEGDAGAAWRRIDERWAVTQASLLLSSVQLLRVEAGFLRARAALAAMLAGGDAGLLAVARHHARALARERAPWATAFALQLRATLAAIDGDRSAAGQLLDDAERAYAAADMRLFATAIRLRKGELAGGSHGASLAAGARDALRDAGLADPDAMARLLCPFPPLR